MQRYLAVIWDPHRVEGIRAFQSIRASIEKAPPEWQVAYEGPGMLVLHHRSKACAGNIYPMGSAGGVVVGKLFARAPDRPIRFDESEANEVVATAGARLMRDYWGSYVAIVYDASTSEHHVLRDPTRNMPCYHAATLGVDLFFSHVDDCAQLLGLSFGVDREYLIRWLIYSGLTTGRTGLRGIEDVGGGERWTLRHGSLKRSLAWSPIEVARTKVLEDPTEAAMQLRSTVQDTVNAWAGCYTNVALKLSGGLDSSIIAACLAAARSKPQLLFLNLAIDVGFEQERLHLPGIDQRTADKIRAIAGHGDERHFARLVAERWHVPLKEIRRDPAMDLSRLWSTPLSVTPAMYFTAMEVDDAEVELAERLGVEAFFSGQAGDSVFFATSSPFAAIDYAYSHPTGREFWKHLRATSKLSRESLWSVFTKVFRHGVARRAYDSPAYFLERPTLLRRELFELLSNADFESSITSLTLQSGLPPGKQNHIRGLAGSHFYKYVFNGGTHADHIDPLNCQPVWELMIQVPTYTALAGGVSRGLARSAFADVLPKEIRMRQVKGTGTPFYQQLVRRNIGFLRSVLSDGLLVRDGYLDRQKLDECLSTDEPFVRISASSLLSYLAAEIWLQHWKASDRSQCREQLRNSA